MLHDLGGAWCDVMVASHVPPSQFGAVCAGTSCQACKPGGCPCLGWARGPVDRVPSVPIHTFRCDAVDAGWPEGHLGGQVFSLFHNAYYTSLWARCMWRRTLRGAQRMLMSERGLAWLALRNAQTQMRVALRSLVAERRRSAFLWLGGRAEHTRRLDHLQGAWCAAARRVLECRAVLHTPVRARPRRRRVRGRGTG